MTYVWSTQHATSKLKRSVSGVWLFFPIWSFQCIWHRYCNWNVAVRYWRVLLPLPRTNQCMFLRASQLINLDSKLTLGNLWRARHTLSWVDSCSSSTRFTGVPVRICNSTCRHHSCFVLKIKRVCLFVVTDCLVSWDELHAEWVGWSFRDCRVDVDCIEQI